MKKINILNAEDAVRAAVESYKNGSVFIYPTDTIYGFGGDPFNHDTVKKIIDIKGRDAEKKFIMLASSIQTVFNHCQIPNSNVAGLLENIWPNPLTVILKLKPNYREKYFSETAAFRVPKNDFCLALLRELRAPLISTSVNRSGNEPLLTAEEIEKEFSAEVDLLLFQASEDEGAKASTIVDLSDGKIKILREGPIDLKKFLDL